MLGIPAVQEIQSLTNLPETTFKSLLSSTLKAMYTASTSGATTTGNITISPATPNDLLALINQLNQFGYSITNDGTNLTVSWLTVAQNV